MMLRTIALLLIATNCFSQVVITDDFSDGNYSANPAWAGDTVFEIDANLELHLNDVAAGNAYLSTSSGIINEASWEFYTRMEFNPSASNYAKVYLASDQPNLSGTVNGYYVRIGGSSNDRVSLYRQTGNTSSLIVETTDDWVDLNIVEIGIKVTRDSSGFWVLNVDTAGGTNYTPIDSALENTHTTSSYFGVECTYTSTRSDKFFFDDFSLSGKVFSDTKSPEISDLEVINQTSLDVLFSEPVEMLSAEAISNYYVDGGIGQSASAVLDGDLVTVHLNFSVPFQNRQNYTLKADGVEDFFGNKTKDSAMFSFYRPRVGDVIINELMVDPNPVIGLPPNALPEREYIELYNTTSFSINLKDWVLEAGSSVESLPAYNLAANGFVVITKDEGVNEFPSGLPILGLDMSSVALTNSGNTVSLLSPSSAIISTVSYTDDWYSDENKDGGGWSLELIDPDNRCGGMSNWRASISPNGGTPGMQNSVFGVNPDTVAPGFSRISIVGDSTVLIHFTEPVNDSVLFNTSNYSIHPTLGLDAVKLLAPDFTKLELYFKEAINPQEIYELSLVDYPHDCSNNQMQADTLIFSIPAKPEPGDILVNEILFNPRTGGSDFVEIYNNSDKIFDLSKLRLSNIDPLFKTIDNPKLISEESFLFESGRYLVFSNDVGFIQQNYTVKVSANLLKPAESLPTMDDTEGSIAIVTSDLGTVVDFFEYQDDLHLAVLKDDEGVSLERISFDKATSDNDNWQSAASTAGFATPGYLNSQYATPHSSGTIAVDPKVFSPNQDGYNDLLKIVYEFKNTNNVVSVSIWSSEGYEVIKLQESVNVGPSGFFTWDGVDSNGQLLNSGIYIVVVECFNENGRSEIFRETCVLSK